MAKIFISYRREDAQYPADRLHAAIAPHVEDAARDIFIDIDNIPLGVNFATHLDEKVSQCEVLLALIGPGWLEARGNAGNRRLDDPNDFVRIEIASALKRGIPVVPVLLDGAPVPRAEDLPEDLKELALRNGTAIQRQSFEADAVKLIKGLGLTGAEPEPTLSAASSKEPKGKSNVPLMLGITAALLIAVIGGFALSQSQFWDAGKIYRASEEPSTDAAGIGEPTDTRLGSGDLYDIVNSGAPLPDEIVSGEGTRGATDETRSEIEMQRQAEADKKAAVRDLQQELSRLGHYRGAIDGLVGPGTQAAADAFARSQSLEYMSLSDAGVGELSALAAQAGQADAPIIKSAPDPAFDAIAARDRGIAARNRANHADANRAFEPACAVGDAFSCNELGYNLQHGRGTDVDYDRARRLYRQACDGGNMSGCNNLGFLYRSGLGVSVDYDGARILYEQACDGGEMGGCNNLGILYRHGLGVSVDYDRARGLYQQACDGENNSGCSSLASLYRRGLGVSVDYDRARSLYQQACDGGNLSGCNGLGLLFEQGLGVPVDHARGQSLYKQACDGGYMSGCFNLGDSYEKGIGLDVDYDQARALYSKACSNGHESACERLRQLPD